MHVGFITLTKKLQKTLWEYHDDRANLIFLQVGQFKDVCQTKPRGENTKNESKAAYREDWSFQVEGSNSQRSNRVYIFHSLKRNKYVCVKSVIFGGFRIPPKLNIFGSGEITKRICICVSTLNLLPLLKVKIWLDSSLVLFSGSGAQAS